MLTTFLQARSQFSLLAGVPSIPELVARAKSLGYVSVALTDVNRMSGLILFYEECLRQGVRPILGVEVIEAGGSGAAITLLARNGEGYGDLCEIITRRQMQGAGFSLAGEFARPWPNLMVLSSSLKTLRLLAHRSIRENLYGALLRHDAETRNQSREVEAFCDREGIPVVAVGDAWFLDRADHELHRILRAIDLNSTLSRLRPGETASAEAFLRSPAHMQELFSDRADALENSRRIALACEARLPVGSWIMPEIGVPDGYTPDTWLGRLAREGLRANYTGRPEFERAEAIQEMELRVIEKLGYPSYFLMVKEVYEFAGRTFAGKYRTFQDCCLLRGSAANSLTFYNLGVGRLDPIEQDLYFQRFLNEDRASPPDADLDFGWDEREKVLEYVVDRFGRDRVAITCTFNHFRFRAAFREVAKVFGYSEEQATEVLESRDSRSRRREDAEIRKLEHWALQVRGRPHFLGQHPGGLLITNGPIWRHVACEKSGGEKNRVITQIDMHSGIDALGLIKFDLLGNGSLSVLRDTLAQIHAQGIPDPEVWDLRKCQTDPKVQDIMSGGRTRGVFYIESPAQTRLNKKADARTFEEVTITSSLIRPAGTAYCQTFVERHRKMKQGVMDWEFLHPSLRPILKQTHDVCAFQEDVTKICHHVAGLSYKQSDAMRKRMNSQHEGALDDGALRELAREFIEGCRIHAGLSPEQAGELWKRVASFTGFSFCKSHSASYAQLSFQCAWLKAHHPAEFLAAVISNNHGFYRREVYLNEARQWGLRVLGLDVNRSEEKFRGGGEAIRAGFLHLHRLSRKTLSALVAEREKAGPFESLEDFLRRVPAGRSETESLILAGAFDGFGLSQPELLFHLDGVHGKKITVDPSLFGAQGGHRLRDLHPGLRDYSLMERCLNEQRLLGYMLSGDPLDIMELHPAAKDAVPAAQLGPHAGRRAKVFGHYVTSRRHPVSKSGRLMEFLTLEDKTGTVDILFWPDMRERWEETLQHPGPFEVWGKVSRDWDTVSLEAERIRPVAFMPQLVDFELASAKLRQGMERIHASAVVSQAA